jgi:hypothetical protein
MRQVLTLMAFGLLIVGYPYGAAGDSPPIPATPEPGAENPAMGPRNSDTGQDDEDADAPKGSFGSGAGSRGVEPGEVPAKSGSGKTVDPD